MRHQIITYRTNRSFLISSLLLVFCLFEMLPTTAQEPLPRLTLEPSGDAEAYAERGREYFSQQEYELALDDFTKAIELDPEYEKAFYYRGRTHYILQEDESALDDFTKAIELDPEYWAAIYYRGRTYYLLQEYESALDDFTQVTELNPEYANTYYGRGQVYEALEKYDLAIAEYDQAIEFNPEFAFAYYRRGRVYQTIEEFDLAIDNYSQSIRFDPQHSFAYHNRGISYNAIGRYQWAITDFNQALYLNPELTNSYWGRGNAYYELGEFSSAAFDYQEYGQRAGELQPFMEERIGNFLTPTPAPRTEVMDGQELTHLSYGSAVFDKILAAGDPYCPDAPQQGIYLFEGSQGDVVDIYLEWVIHQWREGFTNIGANFRVLDSSNMTVVADAYPASTLIVRAMRLNNFVIPYDGVFVIYVFPNDGAGCLTYELHIDEVIDE